MCLVTHHTIGLAKSPFKLLINLDLFFSLEASQTTFFSEEKKLFSEYKLRKKVNNGRIMVVLFFLLVINLVIAACNIKLHIRILDKTKFFNKKVPSLKAPGEQF